MNDNKEQEFIDINDHDTIVFEDFNIKVIKNDDGYASSDTSDDSYFSNDDNNIIFSILNILKEHFIYTESSFFNKLSFSELFDYFNLSFSNEEKLDLYSYIPTPHPFPYSKKFINSNFDVWVDFNFYKLKDSYLYLNRISKSFSIKNNTFYNFCILGFNSSSLS